MEKIELLIENIDSIIVSDNTVQINCGFTTSNLFVIDDIKFVSEVIQSKNTYKIELMICCFVIVIQLNYDSLGETEQDTIYEIKQLFDDLVINTRKNKQYSFNKPRKIDI